MSTYELLIHVPHVKAHVVLLVLNHNLVEHAMELAWKQLKQDLFSCVLHVVHVMVDVKQLLNHVMNVQEKDEQSRRNIRPYLFQQVDIFELERMYDDFVYSFVSLSGVEDGQTMRVNLGVSELFVTFRVKPSDKFRRDKEDIHSDVNISVGQATLGGVVKVPGIYEEHVLQVREENESLEKKETNRILDSSWYTISSKFSSDWERN